MGQLIYFVNNNRTLKLEQEKPDGKVKVKAYLGSVCVNKRDTIIPPGYMIMLLNYYNYVKENNIQNDFINPHGINKEK